MNIQNLETFIQVAENLNFARAAEVLNMTQSAVSRQIHALEDELGAKLFLRTTRTVTLTPAGVSFLEDAKKVVTTLQLASARIHHQTESDIRVASIGCGNEVDLDFLCNVLKQCIRQAPDIHPFIKVIPHRFILTLFTQGDLDFLVGFREDIPLRSGCSYMELAQLPLCCVVSESHPYAFRETVSESDLYSERLVHCNAVPSRALELQNQLAGQITPQNTFLCENLQAALMLIRAGYGFTILPRIGFTNVEINYIPLQDTAPLSYGVFYKPNSLSPLLEEFLSMIKAAANIPDIGK
ncbi:MAG: LysR family transcriptional regulator [Lachnospiraceae bacterium]|nr:LysR family transcriptional regulator [Lachnospiraceae bacterium]